MATITPLGKPLSQQPFAGTDVSANASSVIGSAADMNQPVSAFQWVSVARATWTWLLKPLWYLCVKWPVMMILPSPISEKEWEERRRREDENARRADWEKRYKSW
ncbi:MAG: hypothetical protein JHC61_03595 [Burkholderiaceae bacterium]|nr:hypothetical protein [Burkholderiaceae bacterium]